MCKVLECDWGRWYGGGVGVRRWSGCVCVDGGGGVGQEERRGKRIHVEGDWKEYSRSFQGREWVLGGRQIRRGSYLGEGYGFCGRALD